MELQIELDSQGVAARGVDMRALRENIQAELDKIAVSAKVTKPVAAEVAPPAGAQGDLAVIHWLLHLAGEPGMIKIYAKAAVFGINELVRVARRSTEDKGDEKQTKLQVRIKGLAKELILPATEAVIQGALDGSDGS